MRVIHYTLANEDCTVNVPEHEDDLELFYAFLARGDRYLAFDTESTGLDLFSPRHQLRLVQLGNATEAWVLRVDKFRDAAIYALRQKRYLIAHNAPFDALTAERHLGIPLEDLLARLRDTKIMAHIADPRGKDEGGMGLDLKSLSAIHVDSNAPDTQNDLTKVFNSFGWTKDIGWSRISLDHLTYLLYAGLDVLLAHRLHSALMPVVEQNLELSRFEHRLQFMLTKCRRRGMLLDIDYIRDYLVVDLYNDYIEQSDIAAEYGVDNVNSNEQIITRLLAMGEELTEQTKTGQFKVDRAVLEPLADFDRNFNRAGIREPNPLAEAVSRAKRAKKWLKAYAEAFLEWRDSENRLHPVLNTLQARTARMSISDPPLQQLPSSDWRIRRSFIPDPGQVMISSDYASVEMRVLAGLCNDYTMRKVIAEGLDLHSFTAERVFGPGFSDQQRKVAKNIGFGKVYGGGAVGVARLTGADEAGVRQAMVAYDATFPGVKRYSRQLMQEARRGIPEVITPVGRRLPLDENRLYAATNYMVQSTARDLLAQAVIRLFDAGLGDYILIPIHDEILGQAPADEAEAIVKEIGDVMATEFKGVRIESNAEIVGAKGKNPHPFPGSSWGAGYKAPGILPPRPERKVRKPKPGQWDQDGLFEGWRG